MRYECPFLSFHPSHFKYPKCENAKLMSLKATSLATEEAFERDPGLVWLFYSYRRHKALQAKPNLGHYALVELSKKMPGFITMTQNVDGK